MTLLVVLGPDVDLRTLSALTNGAITQTGVVAASAGALHAEEEEKTAECDAILSRSCLS
jgi:hypothetical protein